MSINKRNIENTYWVQSTKKELEGKLGTTFSLSNGMLGLRGSHEECPEWGRPEFYMAGTYAYGPSELLGFHDADHILSHPDRIKQDALSLLGDDAIVTLPNLPYPIALKTRVGNEKFSFESHKILSAERLIEIDNAIMRRTVVFRDADGNRTRIESVRFVSMSNPSLVCLKARVLRLDHQEPVEISGYLHEDVSNTNGVVLWNAGERFDSDDSRGLECIVKGSEIKISMAQVQKVVETPEETYIELFAVTGRMTLDEARSQAESARERGFDSCLNAHIESYCQQIRSSRVEFDGLQATVQGFNFGLMHLQMAFSPIAEQVGVPIKGLTGHGYRFLNFWDMDFHMFPYYLMTRPKDTRKLLEYRYNQLPQYRENAKKWGAEGAQVPWETSSRGEEETAPWLCLQEREIHISADAAYMFKRYADITGDLSVMKEMGAEFTFETARFYASRLKWNEAKKLYELPDIGCPDQYHTFADNNIFISLWAQWNLKYASELFENKDYKDIALKTEVSEKEATKWKEMAENFYIIEPDEDGIIEQCDGFFELSPDLEGICETYCSHSQAVKQPDVLAAFIPFEDKYPRDIRRKNWHYYDKRTLHGSSLSLPGMAYAAARCGLNDEAMNNLHDSCRMDLDDVNLDTERGVHVSGGAVAWNSIVCGFGGLEATAEGLAITPNLPRQWNRLAFTVHWHFQPVDIEITRDKVTVTTGTEEQVKVPVRISEGEWQQLSPGESLTNKL